MESPTNTIETLVEQAEAYGRTSLELAKLKLLEKTTIVSSSLVSRLGVIIIVSLSAFVLNIGVSLYLGELLGKTYYGFFIVAAFYLLLAVLSHFFLYGWIKKPLTAFILKQVLK